MPVGTCDPATRGQAFNVVTIESAAPNNSGVIRTDVRYGWDGVSVRPNCDGPVTRIQTSNTSNMPAWALLPLKKAGSTWIQIDPGANATVTNANQIRNLGLEKYSDVAGVAVTFTQPV